MAKKLIMWKSNNYLEETQEIQDAAQDKFANLATILLQHQWIDCGINSNGTPAQLKN